MKKEKIDVVYHGCESLQYIDLSIALTLKYIPWVSTIHIIYDDYDLAATDLPKYSSKKVKYLSLSSFLPKKYKDSRKNSCVVESWLWNSKEIADLFIYFCNDMFVGQPMCSCKFFAPDGKPIVRILPENPDHSMEASRIPYVKMWQNAISKHGIHYTRISHCALPYKKSLLKKYYKKWSKEVNRASFNKERAGAKDFNLLRIGTALMIMEGDAFMEVTHTDYFTESGDSENVKSILKMRPPLFCINNLDEEKPVVKSMLAKYLE